MEQRIAQNTAIVFPVVEEYCEELPVVEAISPILGDPGLIAYFILESHGSEKQFHEYCFEQASATLDAKVAGMADLSEIEIEHIKEVWESSITQSYLSEFFCEQSKVFKQYLGDAFEKTSFDLIEVRHDNIVVKPANSSCSINSFEPPARF